MSDALESLEWLSAMLHLEPYPQDWGIINADEARLSEFISFYEAHPELSGPQKFQMGGLILASANDALVAGLPLDSRLSTFLRQNRSAFEIDFTYWRELEDVEVFPIAKWLRESVAG